MAWINFPALVNSIPVRVDVNEDGPLLPGTRTADFTPSLHDAATGGNAGSAAAVECEWARSGDLVRIEGRLINIDTTGMTGGNALWLRWSSGPPAFSAKAYARHFSLRTSNITVTGTAYMDPDRSDTRLEFGGFTIGDINSGSGDIFFGVTYVAGE